MFEVLDVKEQMGFFFFFGSGEKIVKREERQPFKGLKKSLTNLSLLVCFFTMPFIA